MFKVKVTPQPYPRPIGAAYALSFTYGKSLCKICDKESDETFLVNIDLILHYYLYYNSPETYIVCSRCYARTVSLCKNLFNNMDIMPLYINDDNIFVKHFVEKTLKG